MSSLLDIIMSFASSGNSSLSVAPQIARIMRVTRIIKLAGKNAGLQALMATITLSVSSLMNVFALLMLVLFIFSILGVFLFQNITEGVTINDFRNFTNWG